MAFPFDTAEAKFLTKHSTSPNPKLTPWPASGCTLCAESLQQSKKNKTKIIVIVYNKKTFGS